MINNYKFSIVIPCYNECEALSSLLTKIRPLQERYSLEYILVENGSKDESRSYFQTCIENKYEGIKVVYVDENKGYGYGLQQGLKVATGDFLGWIHADLQVSPQYLSDFFDYILESETPKIFLKGKRKNRSLFEHFFTNAQAIFDTFVFFKLMYDITAIPVLFHKSLLPDDIEIMPNDFSIEIYIYLQALRKDFVQKRFNVILERRENGKSSWNKGLSSRIKLSKKLW